MKIGTMAVHGTEAGDGGDPRTVAAGRFAALHAAERGEYLTSGAGALAAALFSFLKAGDSLLVPQTLSPVIAALVFRAVWRLGVEVVTVDADFMKSVKAAVRPNTRVFLFETIAGPLQRVHNIPEVAALAAERGVIVVVDNTMASPVNFCPLAHGVDVVVESCAGYVGGYAESPGGFAAGRADLMEKVRAAATDLGVLGEAQSAGAVDRALQTVALRMERHNENAQAVAEFAAAHSAVERAYYPGLPDHPDHYLARSILGGFGGVASFVLRGGDDVARRALQAMRVPRGDAFSGGVASCAWMPLVTEYASYDGKARAAAGIVPGLLRLSVGLEDFEDLAQDLSQALDAVL